VDCTSARQSAGDNFYKAEDADHMEVCKPPSKEHPSYWLLLQLINTCQEVSFNNLVSSIFHSHGSITYYIKYNRIFLLGGKQECVRF
jgi:hypothetical protein